MAELESKLPVPFTFSQSSLQDYSDCARRFQLRYLERLAWPAVESEPVLENERRQQEGQLFHRLVQQRLLGLPAERLERLAASPDLHRWWDNFLQHAPDLTGMDLHPEASLSAPVGAHRLLAKYDLIAVRPGERALIVDWKTYHKRPRDVWMAARLQTRVYRALLVEAGASLNNGAPFPPGQVEMLYWYADFPAEPARFTYSEAQHKREWGSLVKLIAEIEGRGEFPLTDDEKKCAFCPYRSYCGRGERAGESDADEDGSETDAPVDINFEQIGEIEF